MVSRCQVTLICIEGEKNRHLHYSEFSPLETEREACSDKVEGRRLVQQSPREEMRGAEEKV